MDESAKEVLEIDLKGWQQSFNENQRMLVLFYRTEGCEKCPAVVDSLPSLLEQPELTGCAVSKSADKALADKLGVADFPSLVYLRDKAHVLYDGTFDPEDIIQWTMLASKKVLQRLDDQSFERLTQAATGATTGDWLVAFYTTTCNSILSTMESLGVRIQAKTNVAKVNIAENYELEDRFKISKCPELILFKQGKMYRYDLPKLDSESLKSFVGGFYKNMKAESVPVQKSDFDHLTENIADWIRDQIEGPNKALVMGGIAGVGVLLLLVLVVCCRTVLAGEDDRQKKERKKEEKKSE